MLTDELRQKVVDFIEGNFPDVFVVEMKLKRGRHNVVQLRIDTDKGITMDECAAVSLRLGPWMDEIKLLDFDYGLEVSSPGVGEALTLLRQYRQNLNRHVRVVFTEGGELEGLLLDVDENGITVQPELPVRKKGQKPSGELPPARVAAFNLIRETKVIIK